MKHAVTQRIAFKPAYRKAKRPIRPAQLDSADSPPSPAFAVVESVIDSVEGLRVVCTGKLKSGLPRASFESLLRHCGALVDTTVSEQTELVAVGSQTDDRCMHYRRDEKLLGVLAGEEPGIKVVDADRLLKAVLRQEARSPSGAYPA